VIWAWPAELEGVPKTIHAFDPCARCGTGTWVHYGVPLCYWCATGEARPEEPARVDPVTVDFTLEEADTLRAIASERGSVKRAAAVRDRKIDETRSDFDVDYIALRVYCGTAKYLAAPMDLTVSRRGSAGYLLRTRALVVLTRSSVHRAGLLIFNSLAEVKGDAIVFGVPALDPAVSLVGWIGAEEFRATAVRQDLGYGERLRVSQAQLRGLPALLERSRAAAVNAPAVRCATGQPPREVHPHGVGGNRWARFL
jgi:hypothetical protein